MITAANSSRVLLDAIIFRSLLVTVDLAAKEGIKEEGEECRFARESSAVLKVM